MKILSIFKQAKKQQQLTGRDGGLAVINTPSTLPIQVRIWKSPTTKEGIKKQCWTP